MARLGTQNGPKTKPSWHPRAIQRTKSKNNVNLEPPERNSNFQGFGEVLGNQFSLKKRCSKAKCFPRMFWNTFLMKIVQLSSNLTPTWAQHGAQKGFPFRGRSVPKITTITEILHMGPRASKMGPRASKMTRNRASDIPKSRKSHCKLLAFCTLVFNTSWQHVFQKCVENMTAQLERTLRSGTVAGYARSALDKMEEN